MKKKFDFIEKIDMNEWLEHQKKMEELEDLEKKWEKEQQEVKEIDMTNLK